MSYSDMEDFTFSNRHKRNSIAFFEAVESYDNEMNKKNTNHVKKSSYSEERSYVENTLEAESVINRYNSFTETVKSMLLTEALYKMYSESMNENITKDNTNASIMRSIVSNFVNENGYYNIMNNMKTASPAMSNLYNIINHHVNTIIESADKQDDLTFRIKPEMKDDFFNALDYSDTDEISNAIHDRVSTAMQDFVTANTKDHEDINAVLQQAQEKIAEVDPEDTEMHEYYQMKAKQEMAKIRRAPKGILHHMVTSLSESVIKHQDSHSEFMIENHLDMDKIVTRTTLMYTFAEMLNTSRIGKVDEVFIENLISDLKK